MTLLGTGANWPGGQTGPAAWAVPASGPPSRAAAAVPAAAAPVPARKVRRLAGGLADSAVIARASPACADLRWSWLLLSVSGRRLACASVALPAGACQRAPVWLHRHAGRAALVSAKWPAHVAGCGWSSAGWYASA